MRSAVQKLTDKEILLLIKTDPQKGMEQLCNSYLDLLFHFAFSFTQNRALSEDMVQEVFIKIWETRNDLEKIESCKSYLFKMVRNRILNHYRAEAVKNKHAKEVAKTQLRQVNGVEDFLVSQQYEAIYHNALSTLPPRRREIFELSREQELSHGEIADTLGVSKSFVKKQLVLALKHIKAYVTKQTELSFLFALWFINQ